MTQAPISAGRIQKKLQELGDLKHDIERYVAITSEQANEIVAQSNLLRKAEEALDRISRLPGDYAAAHIVDTRKTLVENAVMIARATLTELRTLPKT